MALITRVSRLLRADLHAVMDHVEEPEVLLRQAVREMDAALGEDRRRTKLMEHERAQLLARERDALRSLERTAEELDVCFEAGQEDLARALLKKRLEHERWHEGLLRRQAALDETLTGVRQRMAQNQARLDAMREKMELLSAQGVQDGPGPAEDLGLREGGISAEEVEIAFLAEKHRRSRS